MAVAEGRLRAVLDLSSDELDHNRVNQLLRARVSGGCLPTVPDMTSDERDPLAAPFALVRRGFDPEQVNERLDRLGTEIQDLAAARDSAVEQTTQLRGQLDTAHREVARLRSELRVLSDPPNSVEDMSARLQMMLRLVQDEFSEMQGAARREVDDLCSLRGRLAQQIDASRELLDRALPNARLPVQGGQQHDDHGQSAATSRTTATSRGTSAE